MSPRAITAYVTNEPGPARDRAMQRAQNLDRIDGTIEHIHAMFKGYEDGWPVRLRPDSIHIKKRTVGDYQREQHLNRGNQ